MSSLRRYFPNQITSPETNDYNCIAWAAEDDKRWWEPDIWRIYYWPRKAPRLMTLDAYIKAYETIGYIVCQDGNWEDGYIKIALFVDDQNIPTHAARLLSNDRWTSKCGGLEDIEHELTEVSGPPLSYGNIACYMKKPT